MKNNEKALKIAVAECWNSQGSHDGITKYSKEVNNKWQFVEQSKIIELFSSCNGLMPIIERINKDNSQNSIEIFDYSVYCHCEKLTVVNGFNYVDTLLIEALQDAILFYHDNQSMNCSNNKS